MSERNTIVLGVTGSIAAYKAADLCSRMTQKGLNVVVVMSAAAQKFVCPQTFLTLSRNPVVTDLWEIPDWQPGHISLAAQAKLLVVAPCSANFIGKYAHGIADDALSSIALAHPGKTLLAPAMNPQMWAHPALKDNCRILRTRGVEFVGPESGHVACGEEGEGRMSEVTDVLARIISLVSAP